MRRACPPERPKRNAYGAPVDRRRKSAATATSIRNTAALTRCGSTRSRRAARGPRAPRPRRRTAIHNARDQRQRSSRGGTPNKKAQVPAIQPRAQNQQQRSECAKADAARERDRQHANRGRPPSMSAEMMSRCAMCGSTSEPSAYWRRSRRGSACSIARCAHRTTATAGRRPRVPGKPRSMRDAPTHPRSGSACPSRRHARARARTPRTTTAPLPSPDSRRAHRLHGRTARAGLTGQRPYGGSPPSGTHDRPDCALPQASPSRWASERVRYERSATATPSARRWRRSGQRQRVRSTPTSNHIAACRARAGRDTDCVLT